jgi:hypothetical protein
MAVTPQWSFCPRCGVGIAHEHLATPEEEHVPARGAFGGLLYGLIAAPILIIAGVMLCLTGWGVFLGIPVMILGVLAPLAGPIFGMAEHIGKCPACGTTMITNHDGLAHDCPTCNQSFSIGPHGVVRAG